MNQFDESLEEKKEEEEPNQVGPWDDVDEEIDPFEQDPSEEPAYKTMYLPNAQLDEMIRTGFLKPLDQLDPLADEPMEKAVEALSAGQKLFLKKFFMRLQLAKAHPSSTTSSAFWRLFQIVYKHNHFAKLFNEHAWAMMWSMEKGPIPSIRKLWLGDLMVHVRAEPTETQWIGYIEALFWYGQRDKAFEIWQLGLQNKPSLLWYSVGTRLHATENQPDASMKIVEHVIRTYGTAIPKLFLPTIVCYHTMAEASGMQNLKAKEERYNQEALKVYHKMQMYCPNITAKEYMRVALSFLDAGYFKDAMKVYQDAVTIHPGLIDDQATAAYWDWKFKSAAMKAQSDMSTTDEELQDLTVTALKLLPQKEKAQIILSSWMRNLTRRNRIEDALKVARYMQTLGLQMDTTTYNLFIMLLEEHGKVGMLQLLAAQMIRKLLEPMFQHNATFEQVFHEPEFQHPEPTELDLSDGVGARKGFPAIQTAVRLPEDVETLLARFEQRPEVQLPVVNEMRPKPLTEPAEMFFSDLIKHYDLIPPADPVTFGLLLRSNTKQDNVLKATSVIQLLQRAKIKPNPKLMSPLLMMLSKHLPPKVFQTHSLFTSPDGFDVRPNSQTFKILWVTLYRTLRDGKKLDDIPTPRQVFADMVKNSGSVRPSRDVYNYVLRCFWRASDPVGAYTAMNGMALVWNMHPNRIALEVTLAGVARLLTRGHIHLARRHAMWYMKKLAHSQFGSWISAKPYRRSHRRITKAWVRYSRKRVRLLQEIQNINVEGGDATEKLEELRRTKMKISHVYGHLQKAQEELKKYWENPPMGLGLPVTEEARAAVSGAIPIDLDNKRDDHVMPEDSMEKISDFIRSRLFEGPWPQQWLDEVVLARVEMSLVNEEAIRARKMQLFDVDETS
ncbi:hypothetical protein ABW20_dc0102830 [Dactylellina cionopaga]|nr:hypothetical protein ABW20_dc0102830 [Dactylellina cionopaga]